MVSLDECVTLGFLPLLRMNVPCGSARPRGLECVNKVYQGIRRLLFVLRLFVQMTVGDHVGNWHWRARMEGTGSEPCQGLMNLPKEWARTRGSRVQALPQLDSKFQAS